MATLNAVYKIATDISNLQSGMNRIATVTENAEKGLGRLTSTAKNLGTALVGALSVGAVTSAVKSFTDLTGTLTDMAAKTGLSTTELQKLKYAAELSGGSLDTVSTAVTQMAKRLVEGDSSAVGALKRLGLNINEIRQMSPGAAFEQIAQQIAKVPNPMEQSAVAMQLFGRSGADVLPMIKNGLTEAYEAAERLGLVMDEETVAAGDRLGDTFTTLSTVGQGVIGKVLGPMTPAIQMVADAMTGLGNLVAWLQDGFTKLLEWGIRAIQFFVEATAKVAEFASKMPILGRTMRDVDKAAIESLKSWGTWFGDMAKGMSVDVPKAVAQTNTLRTAVGSLTKEQVTGAEAMRREYKKLADEDIKRLIHSYNEFAETLKKLRIVTEGVPDALADVGRVGAINLAQIEQAWEDYGKGVKNTKTVTAGLGDEFRNLGMTGEDELIRLRAHFDALEAAAARERAAIFGLADAFTQFGSQVSGTAGHILRDIGNIINAYGRAGDAAALIQKGGAMNTATGLLEGGSAVWQATGQGSRGSRVAGGALTGMKVGMAFGPYGAAIGAAAGAIVGWVRSMNEGRKAVKAFAESFGGFDELHKKLAILGDEGEEMWRSLTQGVGNNNPEQAAEVIGKISAALENAPAKMNEMITAALTGGPPINASLLPYLETLIRTGQLTEENANLLLGLPAKGVPAFAEVEAAAEALGLDINALGDNIKQLGFTESVEAIAKHLDVLQRAGADMNAVFTGSREKIQKIVDDAQRGFLSLPESIKPFLQQMVDAGMLTDILGNQLTDLDDLHFTKPLEKSVEDLITALHELVGVITNDVGGALDGLNNKVVRPRVEYVPGDGSGRSRPEQALDNSIEVTVDGRVLADVTARTYVSG